MNEITETRPAFVATQSRSESNTIPPASPSLGDATTNGFGGVRILEQAEERESDGTFERKSPARANQLFVGKNISAAFDRMNEGSPWDFSPTKEELCKMRSKPKLKRTEALLKKSFQWQVYSPVRGTELARPTNVNQPVALRGLVVDYDAVTPIETIEKNLVGCKTLPNFIETSLSGKARLVWVFERELPVHGMAHCEAVIEAFFKKLRADTLLAGFDPASSKPSMVWANGGIWYDFSPTPISWETIFAVACDAGKKLQSGPQEIPLAALELETHRRWPGRWQGPFELNNPGVRFWDDTADNAAGCQVKPDGMLCFTGNIAFMRWRDIFGAAWCENQRVVNLSQLAGNVYYDGRNYWDLNGGKWVTVERGDVLLSLKAGGISGTIRRGTTETISEAEKVLVHIQKVNRVTGAAPLINYHPGLVTIDGERILNTSTVRALVPADKTPIVPEQDFPWIWKFLSGLFDRPDLRPLDYFLAWTKRAYEAAYYYRKAFRQAIFVCGPKENGKTLLCHRIIRPLLGNKIANPYDYFTGATQFNDELFSSPLLAINDEEATVREEVKQKFLARLKSFVVNPTQTIHPKFCARLQIEWSGSFFVTLNDDPNSAGLLPEKNSNTQDKMMFFGSRPHAGKWDERYILEAKVAAELPFFARWLMDWTPPEDVLAPGRMGVESYFDPRILMLSTQQNSAYHLIELIELWMNQDAVWAEREEWSGNATSLMQQFSCFADSTLMRDWSVRGIARALTTLAKLDVGITQTQKDNKRIFTFNRERVLSGKGRK